MRKYLLVFALSWHVFICKAYEVQYESSDSIRVVELLSNARTQGKSVNYIVYFARQLRGIPYVAHTLEVNNTEKLVVNLRQLDCTTYVENVLALDMCMRQRKYEFKDFCDNLCKIRYRGGSSPHYTRRLHYFTDWIEDNSIKGVCKEVQSPNPPFSAVQKVNVFYMSSNPGKYKMLKDNPDYIPEIAETEKNTSRKSYRYIPKSFVKNSVLLRKSIRDGDIIATTTTLKGLDIQHVGFAIWHKDGLHMLNASSLHHKVVEESMMLYEYLQKQKSMTGIRIIRILQ